MFNSLKFIALGALGAALAASPAAAQLGVGLGGPVGGVSVGGNVGAGVGVGVSPGGPMGTVNGTLDRTMNGVGGNVGAGVGVGVSPGGPMGTANGTLDRTMNGVDRTVTRVDRGVNRTLDSDLRVATSADLTAGATVRDNRGHKVGAVQSVSGSTAVVVRNGRMVHVPLASLYRGASGLVTNLSQAQLDAMASANVGAGANVRN